MINNIYNVYERELNSAYNQREEVVHNMELNNSSYNQIKETINELKGVLRDLDEVLEAQGKELTNLEELISTLTAKLKERPQK